MKRLTTTLLLAIVFAITWAAHSLAAERPNVVVILADDQGWGDLSLHGNPNLATPNIDSLARDGAHVENFYVCSVCSPTRAEFLTGRYHTRSGVYSTSTGGERFNLDERTIADVFSKAGYKTAAYGKWHSGMQAPYHPNARGFDDFYGFCSGHWGNYFSPLLEHNGALTQGDGFIIDDLTTHAIDFIDEAGDEPFFVYLPLNTPHSPMQVPDAYWDRFKDKDLVPDPNLANASDDLGHARAALAMCENIDDNVGRLLEHLKRRGIADNTIVVYFSDNGPNGARFNGGMRGRKGSTYEGGLRSPCVIRYPDRVQPATRITEVAGAIDLLPTLAELANIDPEITKPLDGLSLASLLTEATDQASVSAAIRSRRLFSAWNGRATVRDHQYRMHSSGELYDLLNDPGESTDVAKLKPEASKSLGDSLKQWVEETEAFKKHQDDERPFPIAHPGTEFTQLPARDAVPHGSIRRSNRHPNCTYMTNWVDTSSEITWDVEVLSEGDYEVQMYYACPEGAIGSTLELTLGDESLRRVIDVANDPPLVGGADDRVVRVEGYVKNWKPLTIGTLHVTPGRKTLRLRAIEVRLGQVAEMRLLMFRRVAS